MHSTTPALCLNLTHFPTWLGKMCCYRPDTCTHCRYSVWYGSRADGNDSFIVMHTCFQFVCLSQCTLHSYPVPYFLYLHYSLYTLAFLALMFIMYSLFCFHVYMLFKTSLLADHYPLTLPLLLPSSTDNTTQLTVKIPGNWIVHVCCTRYVHVF